MQIGTPMKLNLLDWIVVGVAVGIIGVVAYRYSQQHIFDLFGLLVFVTALAGYLAYRSKRQ